MLIDATGIFILLIGLSLSSAHPSTTRETHEIVGGTVQHLHRLDQVDIGPNCLCRARSWLRRG